MIIKTACPHGDEIIEDVVTVVEKSLRLYYIFKGAEELDPSDQKVIKEYIERALENKGAS